MKPLYSILTLNLILTLAGIIVAAPVPEGNYEPAHKITKVWPKHSHTKVVPASKTEWVYPKSTDPPCTTSDTPPPIYTHSVYTPPSKPSPKPQPSTKKPTCEDGLVDISCESWPGDATWYDVGLGSCGWTNTRTDFVAALDYITMDNPANPNLNGLCGVFVTCIYEPEGGETRSVTVKVVDTCAGCVSFFPSIQSAYLLIHL